VTAPEVPDEAQQLRTEIELTREHLGATVEELAAKVDVKNRAQAKVAEVRGRATGQAKNGLARARELVTRTGKQASLASTQAGARTGGALAATTAGARQRAIAAGQAAPAPVRQVAAKGAVTARKYRGPLATAGGAGLLALIAFIIWYRSKR